MTKKAEDFEFLFRGENLDRLLRACPERDPDVIRRAWIDIHSGNVTVIVNG